MRVLEDALRRFTVLMEVAQSGDNRSWPVVRKREAVGCFDAVGVSILEVRDGGLNLKIGREGLWNEGRRFDVDFSVIR